MMIPKSTADSLPAMISPTTSNSRFDTLPRWAPIALVAISFLVRLFFLNGMQGLIVFDVPHMDELYHLELARQILSTAGLPAEPFFRAPLYPYLFALVYHLVGESLYWSRFVQILAGSFLPLFVLMLGSRFFDRRVGWIAAGVAAIYPTFLYYDVSLLITSLMTLLTALLLLQLHRTESNPSWTNTILCGLLLGLTGLARPNILLFGPILVVWVWLVLRPKLGWQQAVFRFGAIGLVALAVVLPVTVRNYVVAGEPVLIAWQGGFNFYLGNHRGASGWSASAPGLDLSWKGGYEESIQIAETASGRTLKKTEVSDYWFERGFDEIAADPSAYLALLVRKMRLLGNGYEIPNNQNIYIARDFVPWIRPIFFAGEIYVPFGIVAPLALVGIGLSLRRWRRYLLCYLLLASYSISLLLFFVCARFRQPMLPLLLLFAVFGSRELYRMAVARNKRMLALAGSLFVFFFLHANADMLHLDSRRLAAQDQFMIGTAYLTQNNYPKAAAAFEAAIAADSMFAPSYANLGLIRIRQHQPVEAARFFRLAIRLEPGSLENSFNLAAVLIEQGKPAEAVTILERAVRLKPFNDEVHARLADAYTRVNRMPEALIAAREALHQNPHNALAGRLLPRIEQYLREHQ
jgi:tetratricopeptide (TPR) repeat protein